MKRFFRRWVAPRIIWIIYKLWASTWRLKIVEPDSLKNLIQNKQPVIFAHWHGDELVLASLIGHYNIATMTSTSDDGEMMTGLVHLLGGKTSRGSSTRGAVGALKGLLRLMKENHCNSSMAVDGPKGPVYKVKSGVFELSRLLGAPVFVCGIGCDRAFIFPKAWNKTYFPKVFAKIKVEWHGPFGPVAKEEDPRSERLAAQLEAKLNDARVAAQQNL